MPMPTTSDRVAVADLSTPYPLSIIFVFAISEDYLLDTDTTAQFELTDQRGNLILLTELGEYLNRVGQSITLNIPENAEDYPINGGVTYQYGFTIDGFSRVQGNFFSLARTGSVIPQQTTLSLSLSACVVDVSIAAPGVAGPWQTVPTLFTENGIIDSASTFVDLRADGNNILAELPDPAVLWDGINTRVMLLSRSLQDTTGTVGLTGWGLADPFYLLPGESLLAITSDGVTGSLHNSALEVIYSSGNSGYLKIEFDFNDLSSGFVLIGSVQGITLIPEAMLKISKVFAGVRFLIGQDGEKYEIASVTEAGMIEGYIIKPYFEFTGEVYLFCEFTVAPVFGAGVLYILLS